jgi:hypothetical protein
MTIAKDEKCTHAREMLEDLYRLIEALDRRVPRLERIGELQIAHDASALRERAVSLIRQIEAGARMD